MVPDAGQRVLAIAIDAGGVGRAELLSRCRLEYALRPRWAAITALRRAGMGYTAIGRRMSRGHTGIMNAVERGEALAAQDADFAALVERMVAAIVVPAPETSIEG